MVDFQDVHLMDLTSYILLIATLSLLNNYINKYFQDVETLGGIRREVFYSLVTYIENIADCDK